MPRNHRYPECIFCQRTDSPPTDEHVYEKWIAALWPDGKKSLFEIVGHKPGEPPDQRWGARGHLGIVVNRPCKRCNNGWMNNLGEMARPALTKMIRGESLTVTTQDQLYIARWAVKTAIMYEFFRQRSPRFYTPTNRKELCRARILPPNLGIWLAQYVGPDAANSRDRDHELQLSTPGHSGHGYATTFTIGQLALQVFAFRWPKYAGPITFKLKGVWDVAATQIWPILGNRQWPPEEALDDLALDLFSERWSTLHH